MSDSEADEIQGAPHFIQDSDEERSTPRVVKRVKKHVQPVVQKQVSRSAPATPKKPVERPILTEPLVVKSGTTVPAVELNLFLKRFIVDKSAPRTHTSMGPPLGSFYIPPENEEEFYNVYNRVVFDQNKEVYLVEQHTEEKCGPILIDFDLRYNLTEITTRKYTTDFVAEICSIYSRWIRENLNIDERLIQSFVFERDTPYADKKFLKDGFHIVYPFVKIPHWVQYVMRDHMIEYCKMTYVDLHTTNKWDDIIDKCVIESNGWMMYGSRKPGRSPYRLTRILDCHCQDREIDMYKPSELARVLSIRKPGDPAPIRQDKEEVLKLKWQVLKPKEKKPQKKKISEHGHMQLSDSDIQDIAQLVDILNMERSDNYETWSAVGFCLYNISPSLYDIFDEFSKKSLKYSPDEVRKFWNSLNYRPSGYKMGSLHLWAREDNPEEYARLIQNTKRANMRPFVDKQDDTSVAHAFHIMFRDTFVCADEDGREWYEFTRHRWHKRRRGLELRNLISGPFVSEYFLREAYWAQRCAEIDDEEERESARLKKESIGKFAKKLLSTPFKNRIMEECRGLFLDHAFKDRLDSNPVLIGFDNGVYDLEHRAFRNGKPDDYISMSCGYDYEEHDLSNTEDNITKKMLEVLRQIFPQPALFHYVMKYLASNLHGRNTDELIHFLTGTGANGKSTLIDLAKFAMGNYYAPISTQLLTKERQGSQSASPDIMSLRGKRFVVGSEPEKKNHITAGFMKLLTGGDDVKGRNLYESEEQIWKPMFKIVIACNDLPEIDVHDKGTWRRIRVVPFKSEFTYNPSEEHQFHRDDTLKDHLPFWKQRFMCLMLKYYYIYKDEGLSDIPREISEYTDEYKRQTNVYEQFVGDRLERTKVPVEYNQLIQLNDLYSDFKSWFQDAQPGRKPPSKADVKNGLEKILGTCKYKGNKSSTFPFVRWKDRIEPDGSITGSPLKAV